jgi:hypothetical protein
LPSVETPLNGFSMARIDGLPAIVLPRPSGQNAWRFRSPQTKAPFWKMFVVVTGTGTARDFIRLLTVELH